MQSVPADGTTKNLIRAIVLLLACDLAVVAVRLVDPDAGIESAPESGGTTTPATGPDGSPVPTAAEVLGPDQARLGGVAASLAADAQAGGQLPTPLTLDAERGQGQATIRNALMGRERVSVVWDSGRPLPLSAEGGGLLLGPVHVDATAAATVVVLDGGTHRLTPGRYRTTATVAVGSQGLATPRDGLTFTADEQTTLTTTGGVAVRTPPRALQLTGPGNVSARGLLLVRTSRGLRNVEEVVFGPGAFELRVAPRPDGYEVTAILQGPYEAT